MFVVEAKFFFPLEWRGNALIYMVALGKETAAEGMLTIKIPTVYFYYYFSINDFWINFALWFLRLTISKQFWISHGAYFCSHKYLLFTEALLFYQIFLHWTKYAINLKFIRQMTSFTTYEGYQNRDSMLQLKYLTIKIFQLN